MARRIDEDNLAKALAGVHLVGTDVLGDASGLAGGDFLFANVVEQRGLSVIDMAHHRYYRWAGHSEFVGIGLAGKDIVLFESDVLHLVVKLGGQKLRGLKVDGGVQ